MSVTDGQLEPLPNPPSQRAVVATRLLVVGCLATVLLGLWEAGQRLGELDHLNDEARSGTRSDTADAASTVADALRLARSSLHAGERYALVLPEEELGTGTAGHYRLVALSYLYPAIAVPDEAQAEADLVMVFGDPPQSVRAAFDEIGVASGVWIGRRRQ